MDFSILLLLVPPLLLPFIRQKWSLTLTYVMYGGLAVFSCINMWLHLTNWSHLSEGMAWISGGVVAVCIAIIAVARYLYFTSASRHTVVVDHKLNSTHER